MTELEIVRSLLLRATQNHSASSATAKEVLEWVRERADWLFGLNKKDAKALNWTALTRLLKIDHDAGEALAPPLALAQRLAGLLDLDAVDARIVVALVAMDRARHVAGLTELLSGKGESLTTLVGCAAGVEPQDADRRVRMNPIVRFGLVKFRSSSRGSADELNLRWSLTSLLDEQPHDAVGIIEAMVGPRYDGALPLTAFAHVPDVDFLVRLLAGARREAALGVNILIHGPPGTGKTELSRRIAMEAGYDLYGVAEQRVDGYEPDRDDRIGALELGHRLLPQHNAAMLFDEMEDMIGDARAVGDRIAGRRGSKVFVNRMLESNPVPVIWTTNAIDNVDDAILRRMSFVLHLGYPRRDAALAMLDRVAEEEGVVPGESLKSLTESSGQTVAVMRVAVRSARLAGETDGGVRPATSLVRALSGGRIPHPAPGEVDLSLYEADRCIERLFTRLRDSEHRDVSVLLTGPPGTGKTALAHHFARMIDRPLLVRRASDLLSKWVGQTEANIAGAFERAREEESVLLFDECDSLLFDRTTAQSSWEIGQVNEVLTWLDRHPFPVIAATNSDARLDPATKRRFLYKLALKPLGQEAARKAFRRFFECDAPASLARLDRLTPGDFAVVARQLRHEPEVDAGEIVTRLAEEVAAKGTGTGRIGF